MCFYFHGPRAEWHIFHLNRVTKIKLLHCQAISHHVATIIFFFLYLKASSMLYSKEMEKKRRQVLTGKEKRYCIGVGISITQH